MYYIYKMQTIALNIWSSPRNISTAFMYSWAQRKDTSVVDEPLYAHYLRVTDANHPGKEDILKSQNQFADQVIGEVLLAKYPTPFVVHKQMTHHLVELDWSFLLKTKNIILIRNPREIIASYAKVIPTISMLDIGVKKQIELFNFLDQHKNLAAVIDTNELLKNPKKVIQTLCSNLNIPFDKSMLSWNAGSRKEDGVWAKYWYANVHQSTGFKKYIPKTVSLSNDHELLAQQCQPYFDQLFNVAIKA